MIPTTVELDEYVFDAIRAGAAGFVVKDTEPADLIEAVRVVAGGEALVSPSITRRLIAEFAARAKEPPASSALGEHTHCEHEVMALPAEGLSNDQIADRIVVSVATAKTHVSRAMAKLEARDVPSSWCSRTRPGSCGRDGSTSRCRRYVAPHARPVTQSPISTHVYKGGTAFARSTIGEVSSAAGIVLAGGRSSRMGSAKAALDWHGSTLLRRVTGIVRRCVDGPVIVVRAPRQDLPKLDSAVEVVQDAREGRGPLQGLAAGLHAVGDRAQCAYVSSTDVPFLHPAFIRRVLCLLTDEFDVVLPEVGGYPQPLAAAYRTSLQSLVEELVGSDRLRPAFLFDRCGVLRVGEKKLLENPQMARVDPELSSVINLNERSDYERAHALPPPAVTVQRFGTLAARAGARRETVNACTVAAAAEALGLTLDEHVVAALNGDQISRDPELPLATGDTLAFLAADGGG